MKETAGCTFPSALVPRASRRKVVRAATARTRQSWGVREPREVREESPLGGREHISKGFRRSARDLEDQ